MKSDRLVLLIATAAAFVLARLGSGAPADPKLYVPYRDLFAVIDPAAKAVLLDREAFRKLQAAAGVIPETMDLGQVSRAEYQTQVRGETVTVTAAMTVTSMSDRPVAIPLHFAQIGLTQIDLDGKPALLAYDDNGHLTLIVEGKGAHTLAVTGSTILKDLPSGGMQFGLSLPAAVAGTMKLTAAGDLSIHSTVPTSEPVYDKAADTTTVNLMIGGRESVTVVMLGNGRQEDDRPILLGNSTTTVHLTQADQILHCAYSVDVLRRGVRELRFALGRRWTVTQVSGPDLVKWSIEPPKTAQEPQLLVVTLRVASRGTEIFAIEATAPLENENIWRSPLLTLVNADFQRGYLLVTTDDQLRVRGERLSNARREDATSAAALLSGAGGQLYYHWGDQWRVELDLGTVALRTSSDERQSLTISPKELALVGQFQITAIDRELFETSFVLPEESSGWKLIAVSVDGSTTDFVYRVAEREGRRTLTIELAHPVRPEAVADMQITMRRVPDDWDWARAALPRDISIPLIHAQVDKVSGLAAIIPEGNLESAVVNVSTSLKPVPVGRMAALGLTGNVQSAHSYISPPVGEISIRVTRREPRIAADCIGLITVEPSKFVGHWRINYTVSRASAKRLYLLADKQLGETINIDVVGHRLASKQIVSPAPFAVPQNYNVWLLDLDDEAVGPVTVQVRYDRPLPRETVDIPLIRPAEVDQSNEALAIQATEELAVSVNARASSEVDAVDLPTLPGPAKRLLAAFRLEGIQTPAGAEAAVTLKTVVHREYAIPSALAVGADLVTYLGPQGEQRTRAAFGIVNASLQFLTFRLPDDAQLWSVRVSDQQAKPSRSANSDYRVPLPRATQPVTVQITYASDARLGLGCVRLGGVDLLDVEINNVQWTVFPPPGFQITSQQSQMSTVDIVPPPPPYRKLTRFIGEYAFFPSGLLFPSLARARELSRRTTAASNMSQIGKAMAIYANERDGQCPDSLDRLVETGFVDPALLMDQNNRKIRYFRPAVPFNQVSPGTVIAQTSVRGGGQVVLYGDLHSRWERVAPYSFGEPFAWEDMESQRGYEEGKKTERLPTAQQAATQPSPKFDMTVLAAGRYTLPVDLVPTPSSGRSATFTGFGRPELILGLTSQTRAAAWGYVGFTLIAVIGLAILRKPVITRTGFIIAVLTVSSLLAIWWPTVVHFVNGASGAGFSLAVFYPLRRVVIWLARAVRSLFSVRTAVAVASIALAFASASSARAAELPTSQPVDTDRIIIPYEGDPTKAPDSTKVLVPYDYFVTLWNQANPDKPIELPEPPNKVAIGNVKYTADLVAGLMELELIAQIKTYGKGWVLLPMPIAGFAITEATLDGEPAELQMGPDGMVLPLAGNVSGTLRLRGVTTPQYQGRKGSVQLELPSLPAATLTVNLPAADLELDIPQAQGILIRQSVQNGVQWTVPLGMTRQLSLVWSPKVGAGAADRTLSAAVAHDVYAYDWALVGVSTLTFQFSAGDYEHFGLLLPEGLTLIGLDGPNFKDYRILGDQTVDGKRFQIIDVRLHRPAAGRYELTARWLSDLPPLETPARLWLPRAADVGRESGTVALHQTGGMRIKVDEVTGGRRREIESKTTVAAEMAEKVAEYYWPYRPFSISLQLSRQQAQARIAMNQLVRISADQVQLLVQANFVARQGRVFGASFAVPEGFELLRAVGPALEDYYLQSAPGARRLHVNFHSGVEQTTLSIVLVRQDVQLDPINVPTVTVIDPQGRPVPEQTGRLAVQVAPALEAQTAASENLKSIPPTLLQDWLDDDQRRAVQFAYEYERPTISLALKIGPLPTTVRADILAGVTLESTTARYAYRLRYVIDGSPIDHVTFTLPTEFASLVAVGSPALRNVSVDRADEGRTRWTVWLTNEITGTLDVAVNFALPIDASTQQLTVPVIQTDVPGGIRAIVAVQNFSQRELSIEHSDSLAALAMSEQKTLLPEEVCSSLQYVLQSFDPVWSIQLKLKAPKAAARIQAVIDLMAITSVIDRSGKCRYEVKLTLQNRSEQFLKINLPPALRLWSARVADEPVKPVTAADAAEGEILIPLVKTSPGGLPYEVALFLSGDGVAPLDGVTRLRPPGLTILDVPVMRTTWSLVLPAGYHYIRPGGNMSPVAGTAEIMSIRTEALIEQSRRLEQYQTEAYSGELRQRATLNLSVSNEAIKENIERNEWYIEQNRSQIDQDTYARLHQQLKQQQTYQQKLESTVQQLQEGSQVASGKSFGDFINATSANAGMAETVRNQAMTTIPSFVRKAAQKQQESLTKELAAPAEAINAPSEVDKLIVNAAHLDDAKKVKEVLNRLEEDQQSQVERRQTQLKDRIALGTADNRIERHYRQGGGGTPVPQRSKRRDFSGPKTGEAPADMPVPATMSQDKVTAESGVLKSLGSTVSPEPYVAGGTFSLPVALPEGAIRLDFARPSGEAELTVWAVRTSIWQRVKATVIVFVVFGLILLTTRAVYVRYQPGVTPSTRAIVTYAILFIVIALLLGIIGMLAVGVVLFAVWLVRTKRNKSVSRA